MGDIIQVIKDNYENDKSKIFEAIKSGRYDLGQVDSDGYTALIYACSNEMPDVAMALIQTGQSLPELASKIGFTALMYSCVHSMPDVAMALIQTGQSNPGQVDHINGNTALILACYYYLPEVAIALIQTGQSRPEQIDADGNTALDIAKRKNQKEVVRLLETLDIQPMGATQTGGKKKYRKTKKNYRNRKTRKTERRKMKRNKYTRNKK